MLSSTGVCRVPKSCQTLGPGELLDTSAQSSTHGTLGKSSTVLGSSTEGHKPIPIFWDALQ